MSELSSFGLRNVGFKRELPDYEMYDPVAPNYSFIKQEVVGNTHIRVNKRFRCPFRRDEDGLSCNIQNDIKTEILNHFYKCHFHEFFEENLNCFYSRCYDTFSTHEKLVKHIHKHDEGRESMYFIKFLIDSLEKEKREAIAELNTTYKAEKFELENNLENFKQEKQMLVDEHSSAVKNMEKESKDMESKVKDDLRYYKKKYEAGKKKLEDDRKTAKELESKMKELISVSEKKSEELSSVKRANEDSQTQMNGNISDLKERNAEMRGKISIQQETSKKISIKLEKLNRKYSDLGPNNECSVVKRNTRLKKQLEWAKKQIKAKDIELKAKNEEIYRLTFDGSDDESSKPSNSNHTGEYVEEDCKDFFNIIG